MRRLLIVLALLAPVLATGSPPAGAQGVITGSGSVTPGIPTGVNVLVNSYTLTGTTALGVACSWNASGQDSATMGSGTATGGCVGVLSCAQWTWIRTGYTSGQFVFSCANTPRAVFGYQATSVPITSFSFAGPYS